MEKEKIEKILKHLQGVVLLEGNTFWKQYHPLIEKTIAEDGYTLVALKSIIYSLSDSLEPETDGASSLGYAYYDTMNYYSCPDLGLNWEIVEGTLDTIDFSDAFTYEMWEESKDAYLDAIAPEDELEDDYEEDE